MLDPLKLLKEVLERIPELKLVWGIVALVAAAVLAVTLSKNDPKLAFQYFVFALAGVFLITLFTSMLPDEMRGPRQVIIWTVTLCFVASLIMTLIAHITGCPNGWAKLVGATPSCGGTSFAQTTDLQTTTASDLVAVDAKTGKEVSKGPPAVAPKTEISQTFELGDTDDDCAANRQRTQELCLESSAIVTSWTGPSVTSANCGSIVGDLRKVAGKPNCVAADIHLRGCGYDNILGIKNCKGRGWVTAFVEVKGER